MTEPDYQQILIQQQQTAGTLQFIATVFNLPRPELVTFNEVPNPIKVY